MYDIGTRNTTARAARAEMVKPYPPFVEPEACNTKPKFGARYPEVEIWEMEYHRPRRS